MSFAAVNYSATIDQAFANDSSLRKRVYDAIKTTPQHAPLFEDIAKYTLTNVRSDNANASQTVVVPSEGPAPKKRKIQNGDVEASAESSAGLTEDAPLKFYIQDVSFSVPMRKKLTLEMTAGGYLRARNQTSKQVEFGFHVSKIRHVVAVPVPEKNQRQFNFCVIPWYGDGVNPPPDGQPAPEAMVWTVADGPPKAAFSGTGQPLGAEGETGESLIRRMLNENLTHTQVVRPDDRQFVSAMAEAHRKTEKAYHVKAFRGSKEGYLFFLSTGIFFGFKKPLVFFAFEDIESISYTSVLQRTFNLNIATRSTSNPEAEPEEFELSMIDQADFSGIDTYIKKHGLQDASLAEARRAKKYNVNAPKNEEAAVANGEGEEEESELQKAQRELEDQEDEEEEDYDPGSEGESDGSGTSSDEDDDDEEGEGEEGEEEGDDEGADLMDELGSEAELPEDQV
ncbi:hypothetical protein Plec18167_000191 [Paecilomyces lecythidis]|uniref:Histone chaperone RTT106/FACT complex subunit SPT16-like middle domain-containing protein n=1 Tax=Paecilomyces lecythidis TaxID=3004212 RepID=A0ABR3YDC1_9EURO